MPKGTNHIRYGVRWTTQADYDKAVALIGVCACGGLREIRNRSCNVSSCGALQRAHQARWQTFADGDEHLGHGRKSEIAREAERWKCADQGPRSSEESGHWRTGRSTAGSSSKQRTGEGEEEKEKAKIAAEARRGMQRGASRTRRRRRRPRRLSERRSRAQKPCKAELAAERLSHFLLHFCDPGWASKILDSARFCGV